MVSTSSAPPKTILGDATSDDKTKKASTTKENSQRKIPQAKPRKIQRNPGVDSLVDFDVPRRISGGKALSPNQVLLVFGGVLFGIFMMAYNMSGMFLPEKGKKYRRMLTSPVNRQKLKSEIIRKSIMDPLIALFLQEDPNAFSPIDPCDLYLGQTSIPDSGWGFFAGKKYTLGESIRVDHGHPIVSGGEGIAPWSLLLKPHSVLSNVKWEDGMVLVATRDITPGEEFFLSWEDHASSGKSSPLDYVFHSLPSPEHFLRADEHIRNAHTHYFGAINHTKIEEDEVKQRQRKNQQVYSNARFNRAYGKNKKKLNQKQLYKKESTGDIEKGLRLWKSAVQTYDPIVAKLLPTRARALAVYHQKSVEDRSLFSSSSLLGSLKNQTLRSLYKSATCVSFLEWQPVHDTEDTSNAEESCDSESRYNQIVTREHGFAKGDTVGIVPLLAMQQIGGKECIPLPSSSASEEVVLCPLDGIHERTSDITLANVEYRWNDSTMNDIPSGVKSLLSKAEPSFLLSIEEQQRQKEILLKEFPLSMSWDIVALRDIQQNETVVLYQSGDIPTL